MSVRVRRLIALAVTLWLAGIVPSILWNRDIPAHGPRSYAWWLVLAPLCIALVGAVVVCLSDFYLWAFEREPVEDREARIAQLERDVFGDQTPRTPSWSETQAAITNARVAADWREIGRLHAQQRQK